MRLTLTIGILVVVAGTAAAQYPTQPLPGQQYGQYGQSGQYGPYAQPSYGPTLNLNNFMPNIFNPQNQPISPYMNLLRGGNTATNYFYGVRPGTVGLGIRGSGGAPFVAGGGNRMLFFPQLAAAPDPLGGTASGLPGDVLPSAGHPVVYNNTMGFFPSGFGQAGGSRPGLAGLGATRAHK